MQSSVFNVYRPTTPNSESLVSELESLDNPFWQFSLTVYADSRVQESCLQLQNEYDANVNLLLYCCWLAYAVTPLARHELLDNCELVSFWHDNITSVLRSIRRNRHDLPQQSAWQQQFFKQILHDEILSESQQQQLLYQRVQHEQIAMPVADADRAFGYLCWLFLSMDKVAADKTIEPLLASKLQLFISLVYGALA